MDVGVVNIRSRKGRRRQELATLVAEAKKSPVDPVTGKTRCLSCGHVVRSRRALADHLRTHDGVNSTDFRPPRIVGTSYEVYDSQPAERPADMKLCDLMNVALQSEPSRQAEKKEHKKDNHLAGSSTKSEMRKDHRETKSRKKNKTTPMKRQILIGQVLSLKSQLQSLRQDFEAMSNEHQPTDNARKALKKEAKKLRGRINATACELEMALIPVNRKFTFRQIVMTEYLTSHMELMDVALRDDSVSINSSANEGDHNDDGFNADTKDETDNNTVGLYKEIDILAQVIEDLYEPLQNREGRKQKIMETRRDTVSGKIFIQKPVFAQSTFSSHAVNSSPLNMIEEEEVEKGRKEETLRAETREEELQEEHEEGGYNLFLSSSETSSDEEDEMLGFSDVLTEWAKQTSWHNVKATRPVISHFIQADADDDDADDIRGTMQFESLNSPCDQSNDGVTQDTKVCVIRAGQNGKKHEECTPFHPAHGEENAWQEEPIQEEAILSKCTFIRPHLTFSEDLETDHPSHSTPQREKPAKKKRQTVLPAGPFHDTTAKTDSTTSINVPAQPPGTLDDAVYLLISHLNALQHDHMKSNNGQSSHKWIVNGFAEVSRYLKKGAVKLIIVANNLDATIQSKLDDLRLAAEEHHVPLVAALTRKKIGRIYHYRKRMAVVAVLDYQDLHDTFQTILHLSQKKQP